MALSLSDRSGCEWLVEAHGCAIGSLQSRESLETLFSALIAGMQLHPVGQPSWHQFADTGGITGLALLQESHLACHTFPEFGALCLNVFCCRARPDWEFEPYLKDSFGASSVTVRRVERPY